MLIVYNHAYRLLYKLKYCLWKEVYMKNSNLKINEKGFENSRELVIM